MCGYEISRFVDLSEREAKHLVCSICLNIFDNAISSECGHTFCKNCILLWVADDHNECPECRSKFWANQFYSEPVSDCVFVLRGYQFIRSLKINTYIDELMIRCDFESNGCKKTVELGLHSAHVKTCPHRFCKVCELELDGGDRHTCTDALKKELHLVRLELNEKIVKLETDNRQLKSRVQLLESRSTPNQKSLDIASKLTGLTMNTKCVTFGKIFFTYSIINYKIYFGHEEKMNFLSNDDAKFDKHFSLDLDDIISIMYCTDMKPAFVISLNDYAWAFLKKILNVPDYCRSDPAIPDKNDNRLIVQTVAQPNDISVMNSFIQRFNKMFPQRSCLKISTAQAQQIMEEKLGN